MDKLRALQYFVSAAEHGSLSAAARECEVSVPAVAKLLNALERELGAKLFERTPQGLSLNAEGAAYLDACRPLLEQLDAADALLKTPAVSPRGTLVVGAPSFFAQHGLLPALPGFVARHPDIRLDLRVVNRVSEPAAAACEVFVVLGWPERGDLVHRRIGQLRFVVCAAPSYWSARGVPRHPAELERHSCLCFRNPEGTLLDLWPFERDGEQHTVGVGGWLCSDHRDVLVDAALAGDGVIRVSELTIRAHLASGRLVPALADWSAREAPPVNLLYRPNQRRTPRVRLFVDYVSGLFRDLDRDGTVARPDWYGRRHASVSATVRAMRAGKGAARP